MKNLKNKKPIIINGFDLSDDLCGAALLKEYSPCPEFIEYIREIIEDKNGCFESWGLHPEFLGFIPDYYLIYQYLEHHRSVRDFEIVDVGCALALQHVFFSDFLSYTGIEQYADKNFRTFTPNSRIIAGEFSSLVKTKQFIITDNMFGVANMSLLYSTNQDAINTFKLFKRSIIY